MKTLLGVLGLLPGYTAHSHFLVAHWNTDTGQRIGAASEVEGGGGPPPPPPPTQPKAPTNLGLTRRLP